MGAGGDGLGRDTDRKAEFVHRRAGGNIDDSELVTRWDRFAKGDSHSDFGGR
jgi:hypothetical protein